jgi:hypothetical protein
VAMVERPGPLSLSRQCQLLGLNRAALYYQAAGASTGAEAGAALKTSLMERVIR